MQISIQIDDKQCVSAHNAHNAHSEPPVSSLSSASQTTFTAPICHYLKTFLCKLSIVNVLMIIGLLTIIISAVVLCKMYLRAVLYWLEYQDSLIVACTIIILFTIVALPISVGYIILIIADGYLFGLIYGIIVSIIGANVGLTVAHFVLRLVAHHHSIRRFADNETAKAITRVISGPLCFKIVCFARLTPIPFGLQNTIFALSKVKGQVYHVASFLGLLPAQFVAVYVGTTLRSMQDVLESPHISRSTYVLVSVQLLSGALLMIWIGSKARKELLKALAEGQNRLNSSEKGYNVIAKLIV